MVMATGQKTYTTTVTLSTNNLIALSSTIDQLSGLKAALDDIKQNSHQLEDLHQYGYITNSVNKLPSAL